MGVLPSRGRHRVRRPADIAALTLEERVMLGMALVPEKRELFGTMPVEDNLVLGGFRQEACATSNGATASTRSTRCSRA
jgi:branched-chain amino acid transport system ATP-binding protein